MKEFLIKEVTEGEEMSVKPEVQLGQLFYIEKTKMLLSKVKLATARFEVFVPRELKLYKPTGYYLQVNYDLENEMIVAQYLIEKHTEKYNEFEFSNDVLNKIALPQIQSKLDELLLELKPIHPFNK